MKKKILIIISLFMVLITLYACGGGSYAFKALPGGPAISDEIKGGNSGICVQKGNYVYMINGIASNEENNKFNTPVRGAIYRLKLDDNGDIMETRIMAPKIFYSSNVGDGLYIPDESDKLYYVSPSIEKDKQGSYLYTYSDIFCVNLDGTKTKKIATIGSFNFSQFVTINSKVYFIYEINDSDDEGNQIKKIAAYGEDGKKYEIADSYTKALIGDECIYYTKAVPKPEGQISGDENYNKVYKKAILNGTEEEVMLNGKNISEDKYNIDLIEFKDKVLYCTKNISAGSSALTLYFALKDGQEYQLNFSNFNNPYFLGFDSLGNYKGTLFYAESSLILVKPNIHQTVQITSLTSEPQYLFMEGDVLYFMSSEKMYSVKVFEQGEPKLSEKIKLLDYTVTINMERYYPKKINDYIYYMGNAEEEYYTKYLYRHDITKEDLPDDYKPARLGELSKADKDLEEEAEENN